MPRHGSILKLQKLQESGIQHTAQLFRAMIMSEHIMTPQDKAAISIRAAKLYRQCGRAAAYKYAAARLSPADMRLYFLSRTLEAAKGIK